MILKNYFNININANVKIISQSMNNTDDELNM